MAHKKAGGSAKNLTDSNPKYLGVKLYAGQKVTVGQIIVRQVGLTKRAGKGTMLSRNYTIHAAKDGVIGFRTRKITRFTGRSVRRTEVFVD